MTRILITGASRGIGRAAALMAGARGWSVGVNYRDRRDAADDVVVAVEKAGGRAVALQADVAQADDVARERVKHALVMGKEQHLPHEATRPPLRCWMAEARRSDGNVAVITAGAAGQP